MLLHKWPVGVKRILKHYCPKYCPELSHLLYNIILPSLKSAPGIKRPYSSGYWFTLNYECMENLQTCCTLNTQEWFMSEPPQTLVFVRMIWSRRFRWGTHGFQSPLLFECDITEDITDVKMPNTMCTLNICMIWCLLRS